MRVLIAEDDAGARLLLESALDRLGHDTLVAADGEEALRAVRDLLPELVLLDVRMPGLSGIDVAQQIAARHPEVVVVLISVEERVDLPAARELARVPLVRKQDFGPGLLRRLWREHGR
jgi:two-component system repressor protein LuxO